MRKLVIRVPMGGSFLSPGYALWDLINVIDPVPADQLKTTPLFRNPLNGQALTVTQIREELRRIMYLIGRDGSQYGAHSLRIGGATALAFMRVPPDQIKAHGRWKSDAYERYVRERASQYMGYANGICSAEVDDFEADHLEFEPEEALSDTDFD